MIFQGRISELTIKAWRRACVRVAIFASLLGGASTAFAQSDVPEDAHVLWESLAVVPTLQLADVGWDNNVLRLANVSNPPDDLTATFSPDVQAWLRLSKVKMRGRSEVNFVYLKEFSQFRSVDTDNAGQIELLLGRLTPHAEGAWINARHRRNFEIDIPVRRLDSVWGGGLDVKVSGKTSLGILARQSRVDYKGDTVYLDSELARYLDAVASAEGLRFRFAATPFTTVGVDVERYRNRLSRAPERNSDGNLRGRYVRVRPAGATERQRKSGYHEANVRRWRVSTIPGSRLARGSHLCPVGTDPLHPRPSAGSVAFLPSG